MAGDGDDIPSRIKVYNKRHFDALLDAGGSSGSSAVSARGGGGHATSRTGMGSVFSGASATSSQLGPPSARGARGSPTRRSGAGGAGRGKSVDKHAHERKEDRHRRFLAMQAEKQEAARAALKEKVLARQRKKDLEFEQMYRGLVEGHELTDRITKYLDMFEQQERARAEGRFSAWEKEIFAPIAEGISKQLSAKTHKDVVAARNEDYDKFLAMTNNTAGLFLDIVHTDDYDPFEGHKRTVKVRTDPRRDPIKRVITKGEDEKCMIDPSVRKLLAAQRGGRATLDVREWHTGRIEATPHGHFAAMMEEPSPEAVERAARMTKSRVPLDHYNVAVGADALNAEYPAGKRSVKQIREQALAAGEKPPPMSARRGSASKA